MVSRCQVAGRKDREGRKGRKDRKDRKVHKGRLVIKVL
jgi:hypothetical protein